MVVIKVNIYVKKSSIEKFKQQCEKISAIRINEKSARKTISFE